MKQPDEAQAVQCAQEAVHFVRGEIGIDADDQE